MAENKEALCPLDGAPLCHRNRHDADRMLVWLLAALLWQNGAAKELVLALVYIAMG